MNVGIFTLVAVLITSVSPLYAQEGEQGDLNARLLACDKFTDAAHRLECFNEIAGSLKSGTAETTERLPVTPAVEPDASGKPTAVSAEQTSMPRAVAETTADTAEPPPLMPEAKPEVAGEAAAASAEQTSMPNSAGKSTKSAAQDFGRDSMKPRPDEREKDQEESFQAVIVDVRQHLNLRFSVELDNGQVWRETEGSRVDAPKVGTTVKIKRGKLGGYRMKIEGIPKLAWVRRTK